MFVRFRSLTGFLACMAVLAAVGGARAYEAPFLTTAEVVLYHTDTRAVVSSRGGLETVSYANIRAVRAGDKALAVRERGANWVRVEFPAGEAEIEVEGDASAAVAGPVCVSPGYGVSGKLVSSAEELAAAVAAAQPGDTIVVKNGSYADWRAQLQGKGAEGKPVVIRPETPGGVVFRLNMALVIEGDWIEFREFRFEHADQQALRIQGGDHNRITQCQFFSCGTPVTTFGHIVNLRNAADRNRVDHCYWTRSKCMSLGISTPGDKPEEGPSVDNLFDHNVFRNVERYWINGQENIQLCSAAKADLIPLKATVEYNLFDNAWGDSEIISNKSSENTIRYNVFANCLQSELVLRQGRGCTVEGNVFYRTSCGVRIFGTKHRIVNNLFIDVVNSAFQLRPHDGGPTSADCLMAHNTMVNCGGGFSAGTGKYKEGESREPNRVVNNIFVSNRGVFFPPEMADELTIENNILHATGGASAGLPGKGSILSDPKLTLSDPKLFAELMATRPKPESPAIDGAVALEPPVGFDRHGTPRPQGRASDIGADELPAPGTKAAVRALPDLPQAREWSVDWFKAKLVFSGNAAKPLEGWTGAATAEGGALALQDGGAEFGRSLPEDFVMEWRYRPGAFASKGSIVFCAGEGDRGYRLTFGGANEKDGKPEGFFTLEKNGALVARCTDTVFFRSNYIPYFPNKMVAIPRDTPNPEVWYHARLLREKGRIRLVLNISGRKAEGNPGNVRDVTVLEWEDTGDIGGAPLAGGALRLAQKGQGVWRDFAVWEYGDRRAMTPSAPGNLRAEVRGALVRLAWMPGDAEGSDVRYDVYRGDAADFAPSNSNRVARHVGGAGWDDFGAEAGRTYFYKVCATTIWGRNSDFAGTQATAGEGKGWYGLIDAARNAGFEAPMTVGVEDETGVGWFFAPRGTGSFSKAVPEKGWIDFEFETPKAGRYRIWGSVIALDQAHDSFYVTMPGSDKAEVLYAINTPTWAWMPIGKDLDLAAGKHRIRFHPREEDTRMSRLLVTDDLAWKPAGK